MSHDVVWHVLYNFQGNADDQGNAVSAFQVEQFYHALIFIIVESVTKWFCNEKGVY